MRWEERIKLIWEAFVTRIITSSPPPSRNYLFISCNFSRRELGDVIVKNEEGKNSEEGKRSGKNGHSFKFFIKRLTFFKARYGSRFSQCWKYLVGCSLRFIFRHEKLVFFKSVWNETRRFFHSRHFYLRRLQFHSSQLSSHFCHSIQFRKGSHLTETKHFFAIMSSNLFFNV